MNDELNLGTNLEAKKDRKILKFYLGLYARGFANIKGADKPAWISLISVFVLRLLESIIFKLATSEIPFSS